MRVLTVWRLTTARRSRSAFSGEGARLYGGRWNPKGVPVVYTAQTQALAVLEMVVQDEVLAARYVMIPAQIPDGVTIESIEARSLPAEWRSLRHLETTRRIGAEWARSRRGAVLAVPSAVIPAETNFILNPLHPEFRRIRIGKPAAFRLDPRLLAERA
jgi:RES domain-containing protein